MQVDHLKIQLSKIAVDRREVQELIEKENEKKTNVSSAKDKYQIDLDNIDTYINDDFKDIVSLENEKEDQL